MDRPSSAAFPGGLAGSWIGRGQLGLEPEDTRDAGTGGGGWGVGQVLSWAAQSHRLPARGPGSCTPPVPALAPWGAWAPDTGGGVGSAGQMTRFGLVFRTASRIAWDGNRMNQAGARGSIQVTQSRPHHPALPLAPEARRGERGLAFAPCEAGGAGPSVPRPPGHPPLLPRYLGPHGSRVELNRLPGRAVAALHG